jgi:hypothetical protein
VAAVTRPPSIPLAVWFGSMPESNGKANWTAILYADIFSEGFTLERSEYKDRVRYAADRVQFLLGALEKEPFILDYDSELIEHANDADYAEWEKAVAALKPVAAPSAGTLKVAVDLLREVVGPLEVSAAIIEDEDGGEAIESLIDNVKRYVEQFDLATISAAAPAEPSAVEAKGRGKLL